MLPTAPWARSGAASGTPPALAGTRRVVAVELQGRAHMGSIDRPLNYEQMADGTAALLRA
jgi:hypothetical protein